jgi:hypothetical protein
MGEERMKFKFFLQKRYVIFSNIFYKIGEASIDFNKRWKICNLNISKKNAIYSKFIFA